MIEVSRLSKNIEGKEILKNINIKVNLGDFVSVVGPSGSGKTTLLNILMLISKKTSGSYFFNDLNTDDFFLDIDSIRGFRRKIGIMSNYSELVPNLDVKANIILPSMIQNIEYDENYYKELILNLDILKIQNNNVSTLSSGEKQRVLLARALILNPLLLIADEPTSNLDYKNSIDMVNILMNLNEENKTTIIIATHDDKIYNQTDLIYNIKNGEIRV